jgi:hypothetical protein
MLIRMRLVPMNCGRFALKKQKHCLPQELETGDCWIALSLAQLSGLILALSCGQAYRRVGAGTGE